MAVMYESARSKSSHQVVHILSQVGPNIDSDPSDLAFDDLAETILVRLCLLSGQNLRRRNRAADKVKVQTPTRSPRTPSAAS